MSIIFLDLLITIKYQQIYIMHLRKKVISSELYTNPKTIMEIHKNVIYDWIINGFNPLLHLICMVLVLFILIFSFVFLQSGWEEIHPTNYPDAIVTINNEQLNLKLITINNSLLFGLDSNNNKGIVLNLKDVNKIIYDK